MIINPNGYWSDVRSADHAVSYTLAKWIAAYLPKDVPTYDFGCGTGGYLAVLAASGFRNLMGFEGEPPVTHLFPGSVKKQDLTEAFGLSLSAGNVVCLEVAEHIPEHLTESFLCNVRDACREHLIMSWAVRGQSGDGHVNCLDNHEALALLSTFGFSLKEAETERLRAALPADRLGYFKNTVMVLEKRT